MNNKNKNNISFSENNKDYSIFNYKKQSDFFYERLQKLKKQNSNINKKFYNTSFQRIHKINLKKQGKNNSKNLLSLLSKRELMKKNMHKNLSYLGLSQLNNIDLTERRNSNISTIINISNNINQNILPSIKNKNTKFENNSNFTFYNNSFKGIFNSSSFSLPSKSSGSKFPIKDLNNHQNNGSYSERTNNTSNITKFYVPKKSNNYTIRKSMYHKNDVSFQNVSTNCPNKSKIKYIVPQEKKNILLNSLSVKNLSFDFNFNSNVNINENDKNNNIMKMLDIDLKIQELLQKKKINNIISKEEQKKKEQYFKELANFYDSLPSLIIKNNYEKNNNKKVNIEDLYNNYLNSKDNTKLEKEREKEKEKIKLLFNEPIIKYLFFQKILNTLSHKVNFINLYYDKEKEIILNEDNNKEDFTTHGFEYIPENLLKNKKFEEKELNKDYINIISKKNTNIENNLHKKNQSKYGGSKITDIQNEISPKNLVDESNTNLMLKFLEKHYKKTKVKDVINFPFNLTQDKYTYYNYLNELNNKDLLLEFKNILYTNINKLNQKEPEKNNVQSDNNKKDIPWYKLIYTPKNTNHKKKINIKDYINNFYVKKKTRKVRTPKINTKLKLYCSSFSLKKRKKRINSTQLNNILNINVKEEKTKKEEKDKLPKISLNNKLKKINNISKIKTFRENISKISKKLNNNQRQKDKNNIIKNNTKEKSIIKIKNKDIIKSGKSKNQNLSSKDNNNYKKIKILKNINIHIVKKDPKINKINNNNNNKIENYPKKNINISTKNPQKNISTKKIKKKIKKRDKNKIIDNNLNKTDDNNNINNNSSLKTLNLSKIDKEGNKFNDSQNKNDNTLEEIVYNDNNNDDIKEKYFENNNDNNSENNNDNNTENDNNKNNVHNENSKKNQKKKIKPESKMDKEKRYYAIIKKIVTTINFDLNEAGLSITKNYKENRNNYLDMNNVHDIYDTQVTTKNNSNFKRNINQKKEFNLFDKFIIEYRKRLFYERELHKTNQKLSKLVDEEDKKRKKYRKRYLKAKKHKFSSLFRNDNNIVSNNTNETKEEKSTFEKRSNYKSHFKGINLESLREIEKKKMELLYKIKHDIQYKISRGDINVNEMDNFNNFQDKINELKKEYEDFNIKTYVRQLEEYFFSFEEEISKNEKKKYDEDRINNYLRRLKEEFNDRFFMRQLHEQKLCKAVDFSDVNHINTLNETSCSNK